MGEKTGFNLNKFYSKIFKQYDFINKLFTFGLDRKWRNITIKQCLKGNPESILDLCCGTGDLAISLAKKSIDSSIVTGYDMNHFMLQVAEKKSKKLNISKVRFLQGTAADMPFSDNTFDRITIGFGFRNLTFDNPDKDKHISEMFRVLKPDGHLLILESSVPKNLIVRFFYLLHLYLFLIPVGGLISGDFKAYWYLAHSSAKFYSSDEIKLMLGEQGFKNCNFQTFLFGAANLIKTIK